MPALRRHRRDPRADHRADPSDHQSDWRIGGDAITATPKEARQIFFYNHCITNKYRVYAEDHQTYIRLFTDLDTIFPADAVEDLAQAIEQARPICKAQRAETWRTKSARTQETYITIRDRPNIGVVIGWGTIYLNVDRTLIEFDEKGITELVQLLTDPPTMEKSYRALSKRYNKYPRKDRKIHDNPGETCEKEDP